MDFSCFLPTLMEKQAEEVDLCLQLQNEQLRSSLQQQRKQHLASLMMAMEWKTSMLLSQKDEELASARLRYQELQERMKKEEDSKEFWRGVAKMKDKLVLALRGRLEELREPCFSSNGMGEAEDRVSNGSSVKEGKWGKESTSTSSPVFLPCKSCNARNASMLLLPCHHLCACRECEASLIVCPVCKSTKEDSMEVLFV